MSGTPWLTLLGALPLLGAGAVVAVPSALRAKQLALAVSLLVLGGSVALGLAFDPAGPQFQFVERASWIPAFGVSYALGLDGIALVLVALAAVLTPVCILASWHDVPASEPSGATGGAGRRREQTFFALLLVLETAMIGVFAATDVFLFYVFFEAMLVPMYFLIGSYGGPQRSYAAVKFLLYSLLGGLLMLAAVIGLYLAGPGGPDGFLFERLATPEVTSGIDPTTARWLFLGFFAAFAIKAPLWPVHTWLPDAAAEAPTGAAVLLVGVLDKVGTFGMLRYCLELFPEASRWAAPVVVALAVVGILYGALLAIGQTDLKRLIAYTSVSHFGFIALGIFAMTRPGSSGSTLYMVNHGFATGALFLIAGMLIARRGSRRIADYGGVQRVAPMLAGAFLVAGLATLSLPGLATFVSEFLVLVGTFSRYPAAAVVATAGIVLAAVYVLLLYQRTMTGPPAPGSERFSDLGPREAWVVAPLIALLVALGFYPRPVLDVVNPAVERTLRAVAAEDPRPVVPVVPVAERSAP